jgi:hypothetical protein
MRCNIRHSLHSQQPYTPFFLTSNAVSHCCHTPFSNPTLYMNTFVCVHPSQSHFSPAHFALPVVWHLCVQRLRVQAVHGPWPHSPCAAGPLDCRGCQQEERRRKMKRKRVQCSSGTGIRQWTESSLRNVSGDVVAQTVDGDSR